MRYSCVRLTSALLTFVLTILVTGESSATSLQISFTGVVTSVSGDVIGGQIAQGNPVSGIVEIDTSNPDGGLGNPNSLLHPSAVLRFDFSIGSYTGSARLNSGNHTGSVLVYDNFAGIDGFFAQADAQGAAINGHTPSIVQFGVVSRDTSVLSSPAIPTASEINSFPLPNDSGTINFLIFDPNPTCCPQNPQNRIEWGLTSFVAVPEPTTSLLVLGGLLGLARWRRVRA
jgi:hypothetical protein